MLAQSSADALFAHSVLQWYEKFGRKNLPWQLKIKLFMVVWLSEVTATNKPKVSTVIPYFRANLCKTFPNVTALI